MIAFAADEPPSAPPVVQFVIPERIPADCLKSAAADYKVPALLLLAIMKHESGGRLGARGKNSNGTVDVGPAQLNSASWVPYFAQKYGISVQALSSNMCQAIRAQAYVLRVESNHKDCSGRVMWCGVGRYHAPNNAVARNRYVVQVHAKLQSMIKSGRFE